ncbi:MAG: VCBS repeat-containing protein, partial [Verrucomicrobiota bacterium]|nr:VCBS repeat-containing protein [Verrucomicrobiota bacterium]
GRYPETPSSRLLRNDQGQWVDVTEEVAPGLRKVGMVTSALWSDLNGDGLIDLMVALEYGAIQLFKQEGQRLVHQTKVSGLSGHHGWWNALQGADVDQDGDIDILAMNAGLNTKYGEPTTTSPISLFYGAMDATRRPRLIEAYWEAGTLFPIRGRATVGSIMPWVDQKFPTYRD